MKFIFRGKVILTSTTLAALSSFPICACAEVLPHEQATTISHGIMRTRIVESGIVVVEEFVLVE
jgi:hypothetical protein